MSNSLVPRTLLGVDLDGFKWTPEREHAACLLAMGYDYSSVARQIGVTSTTVKKWYLSEPFRARTVELRTVARQALFNVAITDKQQRVDVLGAVQQRILRLIEARAAAPEMQNVPGGDTGLLTVELKSMGTGPTAQLVEDYKFDKPLVDALLNVQKHAATELGQLTDRTELHVHQKAYIDIDTDEV